MKGRKVISEEMIKGQHRVLVEYTHGNKLSHYEYYVGIPEKHKAYENFSTVESNRWWTDPLWDKDSYKNIKKALTYSNARLLKKAIFKLRPPFDIKNINGDDHEFPIALRHAWLSFAGNKYQFLKSEYCYYGGGMYVPNFGKEDCKISAKIAMNLISNCLLEMDDISPEPIKIRFEE